MHDLLPENDKHIRPASVDDATVKALGKLSEGLEKIERARGALYDFHQLIGGGDKHFIEAADLLEASGHAELAQEVRDTLVGMNVLPGRWTFQIVEEFDDGYYATVKTTEEKARNKLVGGRKHIYESEMKEQNRTKGRPGHEARPSDY